MKIFISLLTNFLLISYAQSACMKYCSSCLDLYTCRNCSSGYFLTLNQNCAPCPLYCTSCVAGTDGMPDCTACKSPAQLNTDTGKCYFCASSCLTCQNQENNCTSCRSGLILSKVNYFGSCIFNTSCPFENCASCTTITYSTIICQTCLPGYFFLNSGCYPCNFPGATCNLDIPTLWSSTIAPYWRNIGVNVYPNYPYSPSSLPSYMNGLDFANMNPFHMYRWTYAYFAYHSIAPYLTPGQNQIYSIFTNGASYINGIVSETFPTQMNLVWARIKSYFGLDLSINQIISTIGYFAGTRASYSSCLSGYFYNSSLSPVCQVCSTNCYNCSSASVCLKCVLGYYFNQGSCMQCSSQCATCSDYAICTSCVAPLVLNNGTCQACSFPCDTCQLETSTTCLTCSYPYSINAYAGSCYKCAEERCMECYYQNKSICLRCKSEYTLINGKCRSCPANCATCSIVNQTFLCFSCSPGFYMTINNTCSACDNGCLSCSQNSSTICFSCTNGMYLQAATSTCKICPGSCKTCTESGCILYNSGFITFGNQTIACRFGCSRCSVTNPQICLQCLDRFYLSSNICRACSNGCLSCISGSVCTKCAQTYILVANSCVRCPNNCTTCNGTNSTQCYTCMIGYNLINDTCLKKCQSGCNECKSQNISICISCNPGYALTDAGYCIKCVRNCTGTCDSKNITTCFSCIDGFYLSGNQCFQCDYGCSKCPNGICSECFPGFTLTKNSSNIFVCNRTCNYPCISCLNSICNQCADMLVLSAGRCNPDLSCNNNCKFCPAGSYNPDSTFSAKSCNSCPTNCATCQSTSVCLVCFDGYFVNGTVCSACPASCLTCFDGNACKLCADGYTKQIILAGSDISTTTFGDVCIACDSNCLTCSLAPDRCLTCPTNTWLFNFRCINRYSVTYNYKFNYDYSYFVSTSQSQYFLQILANMLNANPQNVYLDYIIEGSTIIGGRVSAINLTDAYNIQTMLVNTLPGYSTLQSSSSVLLWASSVQTSSAQFPDTYEPVPVSYVKGWDYRNTIIIVISIVCFVFLMVIALIIMRCLSHRKQQHKIQVQSNTSVEAIEVQKEVAESHQEKNPIFQYYSSEKRKFKKKKKEKK